ncbi:MAG: hypothetical protein LC779_01535 [Actinobacteria bacterium]|nr:hypothetical protein [Actinomycetota bacterium]
MTEPQTPDPHAGLSATGKTADQLSADDAAPGTTYGDTGSLEQEVVGADDEAETGEPPA